MCFPMKINNSLSSIIYKRKQKKKKFVVVEYLWRVNFESKSQPMSNQIPQPNKRKNKIIIKKMKSKLTVFIVCNGRGWNFVFCGRRNGA